VTPGAQLFYFGMRVMMAGQITALKIQNRNKERVNLYLDNNYAFPVTVAVALTLKKGQYLTDKEIEQLKSQDAQDKAYQHAIRYLGFRARSRQELEQYLAEKGYSTQVTAATIQRLLDQNYLDDEAFARWWLENRERFRPRSQRALRYELRQKGIANEVIETVLTDLDEEELAWAAVSPKLAQWQNFEAEKLKQKIFSFLSRRGFTYEVAHQIFERAWTDLNSTE
jgi:regulatory protein